MTVNGAGGAEGLVAGLNEDQSRDILREEIGGDSPRCSGAAQTQLCFGSLCEHVCCLQACSVQGQKEGCVLSYG